MKIKVCEIHDKRSEVDTIIYFSSSLKNIDIIKKIEKKYEPFRWLLSYGSDEKEVWVYKSDGTSNPQSRIIISEETVYEDLEEMRNE